MKKTVIKFLTEYYKGLEYNKKQDRLEVFIPLTATEELIVKTLCKEQGINLQLNLL